MQGILLVDKPAGWTSFDVVNYVRRIVATDLAIKPKQCKVGHTGTLDPFATGLLVLLIGKQYTRLAADYSKRDKTYEATMVLGQTSTTGDPEGDISVSKPLMQPPIQATVEAALASFEGLISQVPPAYSAIKVNGQRSYALARAGKAVPLAPRQVTVYSLQLVSYDYPTIRLTARVSSGTYIRTLVADIGTALNTSAYTTELRRTSVGDLQIDDAYTTEQITIDQLRKLQDHPVALW